MQYYRQSAESALRALEALPTGLPQAEAERRLAAEGYNELETTVRLNKLKLFFRQFNSFLIYILLFAVLLSLLMGEYTDGAVIALILLGNALLGYFQELDAHQSLEALKRISIVEAKVFRDGELVQFDSKYVARGDILFVEAGDKVPADARILEATKLKVEEAALTGESLPVEKHADPIEEEVQLGDRRNMLFSSTTVLQGSAKALVTGTGMDTEIGKITSMVKEVEEPRTPLQRRLDRFGRRMGVAVLVISVIIMGVIGGKAYLEATWSRQTMLEIFMLAVALAVAAVPEGLPAVVTIALSKGVKKLLQKKALVRHLASVETLGTCDVICTDKTGTLTENEMTVVQAWTFDGAVSVSGIGYEPEGSLSGPVNPLLFEIGYWCNNASVYEKEGDWTFSGDPTEAALLVSARKAGVPAAEAERLAELPFDSERKRMSVLLKKPDGLWVYAKGAPGQLLDRCTRVLEKGKEQPLTEDRKEAILRQAAAFSEKSLRILAFACKTARGKEDHTETDLTFVGLQAMLDPPRPDVPAALARTAQAGIRVIMITGDYKLTAQAIARDIGIAGEVLTGAELDRLSDEALTEKLGAGANIFARVIPAHKQRLVTALQNRQHVVAMTGDGVNDAPALKQADIGIAVGSGTEVAKEASDLVLVDNSFANIVNAIEEGRGIYDNIQKSVMHLLSGNLSEVLIIFLAALAGWDLPLTAIMLLWINLVSDGAPAVALAIDPYGEDIMRRQPKPLKEGILPRPHLLLIILMGLYSMVGALLLFHHFGGAGGQQVMLGQTVVFTYLVLSELVLLLNIRIFFDVRMFSNRWLWIAIAGSFLAQLILLYTPLRQPFGLVPLSWQAWSMIAAGEGLLFALCYGTVRLLRGKR